LNYQFSISKNYNLIDILVNNISLNEPIDKKCIFIQAIVDNKLAGIVGFNLFTKNKVPRLEHIILDKPYQRTRLGILLLKEMEKFINELGYKEYYSYILNNNERMKRYAIKWGMKLKNTCDKGSWFYKTIGE